MRPLTPIRRGWEGVVGPEIAKYARPVDLQRGALVIECKATEWAQQVQFLSEKILKAFPGVERLRLRTSGRARDLRKDIASAIRRHARELATCVGGVDDQDYFGPIVEELQRVAAAVESFESPVNGKHPKLAVQQ